jgi:hypothetical protein
MSNSNQRKPKTTVIELDSLEKMKTFVQKNSFPYNLSETEYHEAERELVSLTQKIGEEDANYDIELKYCVDVDKALSDFKPIDTKDNDKRKRKKKISLRIIADENQTKSVIISPGLFELLGEPTHVSFQVRDNVLAIGRGLPSSTSYKLHVEHHGYTTKSESLVDFLCDHFKLLDYNGALEYSVEKLTYGADRINECRG